MSSILPASEIGSFLLGENTGAVRQASVGELGQWLVGTLHEAKMEYRNLLAIRLFFAFY